MELKKVDLQVTNHAFKLTSSVFLLMADNEGLAIQLSWDSSLCGTLPTTASIFAPGCLAWNKAGTSASTNLYANSGTIASPTWTVFTIS